jgi:hypothetical protein
MTAQERREEAALTHRRVTGRHTLRYVMRKPGRYLDVGAEELEAVKRLARWWGIPLHTKALGFGAYRVRIAPAWPANLPEPSGSGLVYVSFLSGNRFGGKVHDDAGEEADTRRRVLDWIEQGRRIALVDPETRPYLAITTHWEVAPLPEGFSP